MSGKYPGGFVTAGAPAGYSVVFDGTGDQLTIPSSSAFAVGTTFTFECWIYPLTSGGVNGQPFFVNTTSAEIQVGYQSSTAWGVAANGVVWRLTTTTMPTLNAWNHIVVTRSGLGTNQTSLFLNGVRVANGTVADVWTSAGAANIGLAGSGTYTGYISNLRLVKGTAVYDPTQTTINVPTQLFPITNTSLLTCQSPNIIDNSSNAFAITANGNATASTFTPFVGYTAGASGFQPALGAAAPGVWTLDEATYYQQNRLWPIYDPYFNQTTLMLHGVGSNTANNSVFVDSSSNNFAITRNGNTTQGTFTPFSQTGWSNFFTAASSQTIGFANNAAFQFGAPSGNTNDFSVEFFSYPTTTAIFEPVCTGYTSATTYWGFGFNRTSGGANSAGQVQFYLTDNFNLQATSGLVVNTWNHIVAVRTGTTVSLFVNGIRQDTGTSSVDPNPTGSLYVGGEPLFLGRYLDGYVSNLRIVKGATLPYNANSATIAVPTSQLSAVTGTTFLSCQSNRFVDTSSSALPLSAVTGTPSVQTYSPFPPRTAYTALSVGGSGYFDGTGDSLASTTDFESSTSISTFTIDGWVYPTTFSTLINVIGGMVVSSGDQKSIAAEVNTSGQVALYWFDGAIKRCTGNSVMQLNAWNYFAIVVTSNAIAIYVNKTTADILSGTTTLTNRAQSTDLGVGAYYNNNAPAQYFNGYLSNIRYSTTARTISVPTTPFVSDGNTRWLLNYTNAGIIDSTADNVLETLGNASISTVQSKYGGSSMYFDGTGDYLLAPFSQNFQLGTGDFTIEFWINASASGTYNQVVGTLVSGTEAGTWRVGNRYNSTNTVFFARGSGGGFEEAQYTVNVNDGAWHHVACVRLAGVIYMYVDGVARALTAGSASISGTCSSSNAFYVGYNGRDNSYITGYLDDVRITKGIARYIGNFTPPTSQLQSQ
jgi:hypothetical protein